MKKLIFLLTCVAFVGSASLTPRQNAAVLSIAVQSAQIIAASIDNGHLTVDLAQAVPVLVNSAATFLPSARVNSAQVSEAVIKAVTDGTGSASTGERIGSVILEVLPAVVSGAEANLAISNAATGASVGANPPKP